MCVHVYCYLVDRTFAYSVSYINVVFKNSYGLVFAVVLSDVFVLLIVNQPVMGQL